MHIKLKAKGLKHSMTRFNAKKTSLTFQQEETIIEIRGNWVEIKDLVDGLVEKATREGTR